MKLFNDLLSAHGYNVLRASDGNAGLQLTREHHPDLIVMDVQLPGGLSGLDVTRSLKEDDDLKAIPVIAVTAFAMKGDDKKFSTRVAMPTCQSRFRRCDFWNRSRGS